MASSLATALTCCALFLCAFLPLNAPGSPSNPPGNSVSGGSNAVVAENFDPRIEIIGNDRTGRVTLRLDPALEPANRALLENPVAGYPGGFQSLRAQLSHPTPSIRSTLFWVIVTYLVSDLVAPRTENERVLPTDAGPNSHNPAILSCRDRSIGGNRRELKQTMMPAIKDKPRSGDGLPGENSATWGTRWRVLTGAILVQMILGTVYGYSIFWSPLTSEIFPTVITEIEAAEMAASGEDLEAYRVVSDEAAVERQRALHQSYLQYAFSICVLSFALVMIFAGRIQDLKGPRIPALIGALMMGGGFLVAGLMHSPIVFYLAHAAFAGGVTLALLMLSGIFLRAFSAEQTALGRYLPMAIITGVVVAAITLANQYVGQLGEWDSIFLLWGTVGFLAGAGIGFAYVCPIAALVKWFPQHKGLVSGLAVAGFGFGAFFFKGDPYILASDWLSIPIPGAKGFADTYGIRALFVAHGFVCIIGIGIGAMLLRNPPGVATAAKAGGASDSAWQETLRQPAFYLLWLMFFSGSVAGLMVIGIVHPFVSEQLVGAGMDATQAAGIGTAAIGYLAVFNALGRVAWGLISDKLGRTAVFIGVFTIQAVTMFMLGHLSSAVTLCIAAAAVGFNYGGKFALFPSATSDFFGAKNLGANYGWLFTSYGIAGVVGITAGNAARVVTGSYVAAFTIAGVLCLISAVLALLLRRLGRKASESG